MSSFPVSRQHLSPTFPPLPKYVSVSACTVWCSHHQLTIPVFLLHSYIHLLQPNFSSDLLSFHPQSHLFWKCFSFLTPLSGLSFLVLVWFALFFSFSFVYFLCLDFISSAFELENSFPTLPDGPADHKVRSWTSVLEPIFDMALRCLEAQFQGEPLSPALDVLCVDKSLSFQLWVCSRSMLNFMNCDLAKTSNSTKEHENEDLILISYCSECKKALTSQIICSWIILLRTKHLSISVFLKWQHCLGRTSLKKLIQARICHENY